MWVGCIKEAENTTESNEFSHYCSIQGALSPRNHHPLVRQNRSCPPICRYKRLWFPREWDFSLCALIKLLSGTVTVVHCWGMQINELKKIPKPGCNLIRYMRQRTLWNLKLSKFEFQFPFYPRIRNTLSLVSGFISGIPFTLKPLLLLFIAWLGHREESSGPPHP